MTPLPVIEISCRPILPHSWVEFKAPPLVGGAFVLVIYSHFEKFCVAENVVLCAWGLMHFPQKSTELLVWVSTKRNSSYTERRHRLGSESLPQTHICPR